MSRGDPTYWRVSPKFWRHAREYEWTDDTRHMALYLLTCEHRTTEGLYFLPVGYMATDLTWVVSRVTATLTQTIAHGFVQYDHRASVVFLPKAMKYQRPDNPNQQTSAVRRVLELPKTCLFAAFLEAAGLYAQAFAQALQKALPQGYTYPTATATTKATTKDQEPSPASNEASGLVLLDEAVPIDKDPYGPDFLEWWEAYGKVGGRAVAKPCYVYWRKEGVSRDKLLLAAANYIQDCHSKQRSIAHGSTFLAKKDAQRDSRWHEWTTGEDHGDGHAQQRSGRQVDTTFGVLRQLIEEEA